jgi:signal transduction histidine kinase
VPCPDAQSGISEHFGERGQAIEGEGKNTVRTRREGEDVEVTISDTGRGIKPEDRSKILAGGFTTKAIGVGTGLGLAISKKIVEETHGGFPSLRERGGGGHDFHIRIPIEQVKTSGELAFSGGDLGTNEKASV